MAPRSPAALRPFPTRRSSDLALQAAEAALVDGVVSADSLRAAMQAELARSPLGTPDYLSIADADTLQDRKSTRLNSSHLVISYAVFCLKKKTRFQYHDGAHDQ